MLRYSEETVNILVRDALNFEKRKRFSEAIEIYEELALQGVEFAIDRIPIAKHRLDNYKLRKIELFTNIILACVIGLSIVSISYNIGINILSHHNIESYLTINSNESQKSSPLIKNVVYHSIKEFQKNEFEFEIFVKNDITRTELTERVIEAVEAYSQQTPLNEKELKIGIKTIKNKTAQSIGYIESNMEDQLTYNVYISKGAL